MRIAGLCLGIGLIACAHGQAGSSLSVTVMQTGSIYPPLADNCPVRFVNAQHIDILTSGEFDQLGMIAVAGAGSEIDRAISKLPDAVATAACKMGGNAISIANTLRNSSDTAILQFSIWRSRETGTTPAPTAESTGKRI